MRKEEARRAWVEQNRKSWNVATPAHNSHKADQAKFLREGGSTLFPEELELAGDLVGKRVLHLQCNSGQDSLSLAKLGAHVTGVDISDAAIDFARQLSQDSGIDATFERADIFDWMHRAEADGRQFDLVFSTYGALPWVPDIERWASGIAGVVARGGRVVSLEFHPTAMMFDEDWQPRYPYSGGGRPHREEAGVMDYVAASDDALTPSGRIEDRQAFKNPEPCYEFAWGVADITGSLLRAGLRLERIVDYPHSNGCAIWNRMRREGRRFYAPDDLPLVPLMLGVVARRE